MEIDGSEPQDDDLGPLNLSEGEAILRRWPAPGGRGVLTNFRCVVLGRPHPLQRRIRWSVPLQGITRLEVQKLPNGGGRGMMLHGSFGGGALGPGTVDATFCVIVDRTLVYIGDPDPCGAIQAAVDDARTARCLAVLGRLVPFEPGAPIRGKLLTPNATDQPDVPAPPVSFSSPEGTPAFILFLAGEPFQDAVPMAGTRVTAIGIVGGGPGGVVTAGGHIPADRQPGQIYGPQAEIGRMVLEIAHHCQIPVKIVDVDNTGSDLALVQRWVGPNDDLPALVRTDGSRLAGEAAMTPVGVAEFLQRP